MKSNECTNHGSQTDTGIPNAQARAPRSIERRRTGELAVEPLALVLHLGLEAGRHLGVAAEAVLEQLETLCIAERIEERLADLEVAPAPPHARLGALLGRGADERVGGVELLEVLDDCDDLERW